MRRIAIAALLALSGALVAQVATIEPAFAAAPTIAPALTATSVNVGTGVGIQAGTATGDGINGDPEGTLTFHIEGGANQQVALTGNGDGTSSFQAVGLGQPSVGSHQVTFDYTPSNSYDAINGAVVGTVTVNAITPTVSATPSPTTVTIPGTFTVSGSVTGSAGAATGTVDIREGNTTLTTATLNGLGNYTSSAISLPAGGHSIHAHYNGEDANYNAADSGSTTVTFSLPVTTINVTSSATTTYGADYILSGNVTSGAGTPAGVVHISIDGVALPDLALTNATFSVHVGLRNVGARAIALSYDANGNFSAATRNFNLTVNKAPVTVGATTPTNAFPGQKVPVAVTVVPNGTLLPGVAALTGTVTAPNSDGPKTLATGAATVTLNPLTGNASVAFTYSGDANYAAGGITKPITFSKYQLELAIADAGNCKSPGPSCANVPPGVPMPLKAVLTLAAGQPTPPAGFAPTGTVHFTDSRGIGFWTPQDPGIVASGGGWAAGTIAQFGAAGADNVTASYAGNANFAAVNNNSSALQVGVSNADHNTRYVYWVYNDLLGRGPDAAGLSYWAGLLNGNPPTPRPAVAWALANSNEYRADVISRLYVRYLGRQVDPGGLNYWVGQVANGLSFEWFQSILAGSDEYYQRADKGGNNPTKFVTSMYSDVLNRGPDAGGLNFFVGQLNAGVPRPQVVGAIMFSQENLANTVNGYYNIFLSRQSDPAGLNYWVGQLQAGGRDELIIALIVGSDEYFSLV